MFNQSIPPLTLQPLIRGFEICKFCFPTKFLKLFFLDLLLSLPLSKLRLSRSRDWVFASLSISSVTVFISVIIQ